MLNQLDTIKILVSDDFEAMNCLISEHLAKEATLVEQLCRHLIDSGGKRLRPLIVFLAVKACGYQGNTHIHLAAAVEYFHTATLLHDDVVDESTLRRGKKTANEIWDSKACILVGDYLFTQSFQWIILPRNFDIIDLFSNMATHILRGEMNQLSFRHNTEIDLKDYFEVIRSKTALLFSASAELAAHLTNSSLQIREALRKYGLHLGNAFQMVDDAMDYCSNSEVMGKNVGDDLADGKMTLPLICAMHRGTSEQIVLIKKSIEKGSLEYMPELLKIIEETKAIDYTYELASQEVEKAITALNILEDSPYKQALLTLAHFAVSRKY